MRLRIKLGRGLLSLGSFIQSLTVVIMKPDDLIGFSKLSYSKPDVIEGWSNASIVESGLSKEEQDLLESIPLHDGELLLLGVGGGREAIVLSGLGFTVTGIDYVSQMAERCMQNCAQAGFRVKVHVQEFSNLDLPNDTYDLIWMSAATYSCIPTRERRASMVKKLYLALKPKGYFVCQFHLDSRLSPSKKGVILRKLLAWLTFGNHKYQPGDTLWGNVEFMHSFSSTDEVRKELEECGLHIVRFQTDINPLRCGVICNR